MKKIKTTHDLAGLMKYVGRPPWDEVMDAMLSAHLGPACDTVGLQPEGLFDLVGAADKALLWGCAFEDLMGQTSPEPDKANLVDDYLERRGWKETAPNKAYMRALRDTAMSLYEVSEVIPGQSMVLRDLLRETPPVTVQERSATQSLVDGDRIGARVLDLTGRHIVSGAILLFSADGAALVVDAVARVSAEPIDEAGFDVTDREALLHDFAPMFTNIWVMDRLSATSSDDDPDQDDADEAGEDVEDWDLDFAPMEMEGMLHEMMTRQFRVVLEEPVAALGNRAPRALARTQAGRVKVANWLRSLERQAATFDAADPVTGYDFGWMWEELGLARLRGKASASAKKLTAR